MTGRMKNGVEAQATEVSSAKGLMWFSSPPPTGMPSADACSCLADSHPPVSVYLSQLGLGASGAQACQPIVALVHRVEPADTYLGRVHENPSLCYTGSLLFNTFLHGRKPQQLKRHPSPPGLSSTCTWGRLVTHWWGYLIILL